MPKIHIYSLQTAVALSSFEIDCFFTRNIQDGSGRLHKKKHPMKQRRVKDVDFQPKTDLHRGK